MSNPNSSLLDVVNSAALEMGLSPITTVAGTLQIPTQLTALYNATGQMLVKRRVWRWLLKTHTFQAVQDVALYPLPPDYARPISQTEWDRTNRWPMIGPETPQQWQWLQSGILSTGPRERFRLVDGNIEIWPVPGSTTVPLPIDMAFNYVSKWWCVDAAGQAIPSATRDDDSCIFDDRLMISGVKLRYYQAKGWDTTAFAADFQSNLDDALAQDSGAQVLSLARSVQYPLISVWNIQDGNYPGNT